ncbi:hypothetical protein DVV81_13090 [Clostridium botulinum]|uniref:hypothetical protein n=1 Tax=Clostridium botulinum TaxID=1491 RepID=UPI001966CEF4|nr:hypothetical protein [Clostridium botulinum]MBN1072093.1 hypothetical protein [Clostridium botulinum]
MNVEVIWKRIKENEGEIFQQIRGGEFSYKINGKCLYLSRTNHSISKATLGEALKKVPLANTVPLQNLHAPSYLYAILMDKRIRKKDW